jgi:hypothetical protein
MIGPVASVGPSSGGNKLATRPLESVNMTALSASLASGNCSSVEENAT